MIMDKNKLIVANTGDDTISIIDIQYDYKAEALLLNPFTIQDKGKIIYHKTSCIGPHQVATSSEKDIIYTVNSYDNSIFKVNISKKKIENSIIVGKFPSHMQSINGTIYVTNSDSNSLSLINEKDFILIENISVGEKPHDIKVDEVNNRVFVANSNGYSINYIDSNNNNVGTIRLNYNPQHLYILDRKMYILCPQSNGMLKSNISVLNLDKLEVDDMVDIEGVIMDMTIIMDKNIAFITNGEDGCLYKVDLLEGTLIDKYFLGGMPNNIVWDEEDYLIITDSLKSQVRIFDMKQGNILRNINIGLEPNGLVFT